MDSVSRQLLATGAFEAPTGQQEYTTGQQEYTTAGTYTWTCPVGVTSVSVVCVGPGGNNGRGGSLRYVNNISVTPGTGYTVVVGAAGSATNSSFNGTTVVANAGANGAGGIGTGGDGGAGGVSLSGAGGGGRGRWGLFW